MSTETKSFIVAMVSVMVLMHGCNVISSSLWRPKSNTVSPQLQIDEEVLKEGQEGLKRVVETDPSWERRRDAMFLVTDEEYRFQAAISQPHPEVQTAAIIGVRDHRLLQRAAMDHRYASVITEVIHRLAEMGDQATLVRIALEHPEPAARLWVLQYLEDRGVVHRVAVQDPDSRVRAYASEVLFGPKTEPTFQ